MAKYTILLIDYEPRSIERFRDPLVSSGYTVEIATDGITGIEAFHRLSPDMVLVEAMIPKKHGFEVCQELKKTPHGRRTPVLITTGVYKGRKYRTQALHIYGCDEYIEKPIAPEQLLALVGRFLGSSAAGSTGKSTEPAAEPASKDADGAGRAGGVIAARPTDSPKPIPPRDRPAPRSEVDLADGTEEEIMARLDAIMPGGSIPSQRLADPIPVAVAAVVEETREIPVNVSPGMGQDPIAQIRDELDAELDSFSAALALAPAPTDPVPDPIPSDQTSAPSVFEVVPSPEVGLPGPPQSPSAPGQVVSFDTKRPRKTRKAERQNKANQALTAAAPPATRTLPTPRAEPKAPPREVSLPRGSVVASELGIAAERRGMPVWVWAVVGLVGIAAVYIAFSRSASIPTDASPLAPPPKPIARLKPDVGPDATAPPSAQTNASSTASAPAAEPPPAAPEPPKIVLNSTTAPAAKKSSDRSPVTPPDGSTSLTLKSTASKQAAPQRDAASPKIAAAASAPRPSPKKPAEPTGKSSGAAQQAPSAPVGFADATSGVESIPDAALTVPKTTVTSGEIVPIDEADVMPVPVTRTAPSYSLQAREMRLSGTVVMNVLVNEYGNVDRVVLVSGVPGADVNESALKAARSWTYRPATKHGIPVRVWKSEQVVFKP